MNNGVFISRTDFNQLMKDVAFLKEYILASSKSNQNTKWVTPEVAMEMLGIKGRKLQQLRMEGKLIWKTSGAGRNIMIQRASIENFIKNTSTFL